MSVSRSTTFNPDSEIWDRYLLFPDDESFTDFVDPLVNGLKATQ